MSIKKKLVVIWGGNDVLSASIKYFLTAREELIVAKISTQADLHKLLVNTNIKNLDIVIIHQKYHDSQANIPFQLLQSHPNIKVIQLSLENNLMDIYCKQEILIRKPIDLLSVI